MIGGEPYDVTFFFVSAESYDEAKESLPPPMTWAQTCTILQSRCPAKIRNIRNKLKNKLQIETNYATVAKI